MTGDFPLSNALAAPDVSAKHFSDGGLRLQRDVIADFLHGLRRLAATSLNIDRPVILRHGRIHQQMPGFLVLAVSWPALAARREMQVGKSRSNHRVGNDEPVVGWNDVEREKINCPTLIATVPGAFEVKAVAALGMKKTRALH